MSVGGLQIESVVDQVYAVVRRRILNGELPRGARLRQEAIAEDLGVSRTPLREALRRLAAEGYVDLHPNRGARVSDLSLDPPYSAGGASRPGSPGRFPPGLRPDRRGGRAFTQSVRFVLGTRRAGYQPVRRVPSAPCRPGRAPRDHAERWI